MGSGGLGVLCSGFYGRKTPSIPLIDTSVHVLTSIGINFKQPSSLRIVERVGDHVVMPENSPDDADSHCLQFNEYISGRPGADPGNSMGGVKNAIGTETTETKDILKVLKHCPNFDNFWQHIK